MVKIPRKQLVLKAVLLLRKVKYLEDNDMKQMVIVIGLGKDDTAIDVETLALDVMGEVNDRGYAIDNIAVDGKEVFGSTGFNNDFLSQN